MGIGILSGQTAARWPCPQRVHAVPSYHFEPVAHCDMCVADSRRFEVMGMRLNHSQGLTPRRAAGIAVSVKKCRTCDLIFADPQPVPDNFDAHYNAPEDYWTAEQLERDPEHFTAEIATAKRLLGLRGRMRALDVGAGLGKAMTALNSAGFDAYGLEPSPEFRKAALAHGGIRKDRLALGAIEDAEYPPDYFDFVTFGAVLEHLRSPSRSLERALGWLKPGGVIHAEVPSSRWLISRLVNAYYRMCGTRLVTNISPMHVPYHLFEFSPRSFEFHGRRAGYAIAEQRFMVCSIPHAPRLLHAPLRWWMNRAGTGMQLEVYLRKPARRD
jgi:SAM-dependent methyltransferase